MIASPHICNNPTAVKKNELARDLSTNDNNILIPSLAISRAQTLAFA